MNGQTSRMRRSKTGFPVLRAGFVLTLAFGWLALPGPARGDEDEPDVGTTGISEEETQALTALTEQLLFGAPVTLAGASASQQDQPRASRGDRRSGQARRARQGERRGQGERPDRAQPERGDPPRRKGSAQEAERGKGGTKVGNLLEGIDPSMFNLSGAELDVQVVGDTVLLVGTAEDIAMLELLITVLDESRDQKEIRIVTVSEKDANDLAATVERSINAAFDTPNRLPQDEVSVTALSSNILLVAALPDEIDLVVSIIESVDAVRPELPDVEVLAFQIEYRRASEVADQLTEMLRTLQQRQGSDRDQGELTVRPNDANNTIIVLAPEAEREKIQRLIDVIDVEPAKGFGELRFALFPLLHSDAVQLAGVINELLATDQDREAAQEAIRRLVISKASPTTGEMIDLPPINLERKLQIIPETGTNSLIIATVEENILPMGELIRLLDSVAVSEEVGVRIFPLTFADAATLGEMLQGMFDDGKNLPEEPGSKRAGDDVGAVPEGVLGRGLVYNISIRSDDRTNTLVVTGRQEQLVLVQMIVEELDVPSGGLKFPLRMVPLEYADATRVSQIITELTDQRIEAMQNIGFENAALERERIFLSVDVRTNTLILSASDENFVEISEMVSALDGKPASLFDQIRLLPCGRLSAVDMKDKIEQLWERKAELLREAEQPEDMPVLVADERSNMLVVASSAEDFDDIERLVTALAEQPMVDTTRLFKLEIADAVVLADMLTELFDGMASLTESDSFKAPTIIPDPRSNALMVAAMQDVMERVEDLVVRLDVKPGPASAQFVAYGLEYGSAVTLAARMQELFDSRDEGQDINRTPVVILPEEESNTLIASASLDDHAVIADLLVMLDKPSDLARQFAIFPLERAKAPALADQLRQLFESQADGATGRADAMAVEADERINALIVWASPGQMENIADVIRRLDTTSPAREMQVRIITLKQALAVDFAQLLEDTFLATGSGNEDEAVIVSFPEKQPDGSIVMRKLLRQDIRLNPDARTNSLMVMAPAESMDMLESMIHDFDQVQPVKSEIRLFPLYNADAEAMVEQLTELFGTDGAAGDEARNQLFFGDQDDERTIASVGQELRFAADRRTNTVIATGADVDLQMVEDLLYFIDRQDTDDRVVEVYKTKFVSPDTIASAIQGIVDQEEEPYADLDDEMSQMRRAERKVSIQAVQAAEDAAGGNNLLVGMSRRYRDRTMALIEELDRPEPQVLIRVLIAEVTLTDSVELGIEFAGQDLRFSENAVLGPNGIIQGSDFDFVLGTDLGAAGLALGGLGFTLTGEDFSFLFHALQSDSRTEVLSRPVIMVQNGQEGKIEIADRIPFVSSVNLSGFGGDPVPSIEYQDVGIKLIATPHISPDGYVTIDLSQEISNFSGETMQIAQGITSPSILTRNVNTSITVRDGETVVVGGLITERESESENRVPILGDLPLIGPLFRSTSKSTQKTELLVVLNVHILDTDAKIRRASEEERDHYSPSVRQHKFMEGLRIRPNMTGLGPDTDRSAIDNDPPLGHTERAPREPVRRYGPKPKIYGPAVMRPRPTTDTATAQADPAPPPIAIDPLMVENALAERGWP